MKRLVFVALAFSLLFNVGLAKGEPTENVTLESALQTVWDSLFVNPNFALQINELADSLDQISGGVYRSRIVNNYGACYWIQGDLDRALGYFTDLESMARKRGDSSLLKVALNNLGIISIDLEDWNKAIAYELEALKLSEKLNQPREKTSVFINLGVAHRKNKALEEGLRYLDSAWVYASRFDQKDLQVIAGHNLSELYLLQGHVARADSFALLSYQLAQGLGNHKNEVHAILAVAKVRLATEDYDRARKLAEEALELAYELDFTEGKYESYYVLYEHAKATNDAIRQVSHFENYIKIKEKVINPALVASIKSREQEQVLEKARQANESAHFWSVLVNWLYVLLGVLTLIVGALVMRWKFQRVQVARLNESNQKKEHRLATMEESQDELRGKLAEKDKEVLKYAFSVERQEALTIAIEQALETAHPDSAQRVLKKLKQTLSANRVLSSEWKAFEKQFAEVNDSFYKALLTEHPKLTPAEMKVAAFVRLQLTSKQIAELLQIAPSSVDVTRHRLRKKLGLAGDENLFSYLNTV